MSEASSGAVDAPDPNRRDGGLRVGQKNRRATLLCRTGATIVRLLNLSQCGMMAECAGPPARGEAVRVALAEGSVLRGRIRWVEDERFGVEFDRPLPPTLLWCG